jgi:hypothetical protein
MTDVSLPTPEDFKDTVIVAIDRHRLAQDAALVSDLATAARLVPCDTATAEAWWVLKLDAVHALIQELEADREVLVRPLLRDKRLVDEAFKAVTGPATALKDTIKGKLAGRQEALRLAQAAAQEAARAAAEAGDLVACGAALAAIPETSTIDGAKTQWLWEAEVVDATIVPRQFLKVDEAALAKFAKAFAKEETIPDVPGVEFRRTARVSAKGKK